MSGYLLISALPSQCQLPGFDGSLWVLAQRGTDRCLSSWRNVYYSTLRTVGDEWAAGWGQRESFWWNETFISCTRYSSQSAITQGNKEVAVWKAACGHLSRWQHESSSILLLFVLLCVFHRNSLFTSGVFSWALLIIFSCDENNHLYLCVVFVHLCLCVFSRGVDLPVVCVFLPVGQSVGSHSWSQRCPHGRCTRHRGLLILLYRHLGEHDRCCLLFTKNA